MHAIQAGAEVLSVRLKVDPRLPKKIFADIILNAKEGTYPFLRSGAFISKWLTQYGSLGIQNSEYLGIDLNTIGKNMIEISSPTQQFNLRLINQVMKDQAHRIKNMRSKDIPGLQRKISAATPDVNNPSDNIGRKKRAIGLLYRRIKNLTKDAKQRCNMNYVYAAALSDARALGWDALNKITTRNQPKTLATAIPYLPKSSVQREQFVEWINNLKDQQIL